MIAAALAAIKAPLLTAALLSSLFAGWGGCWAWASGMEREGRL